MKPQISPDSMNSQHRVSSTKSRFLPRSLGIGIAIAAMGFAAWAQADTPSSISSTTFSSGTTISSSEVNTNFSNLYDSVNALLQSIFVKSDGNVGIGTITPAQKLSVAGTVESTTGGFKFPDGTTQTTAATASGSSVWTASGSNAYFNSGNVGIGTTTPTEKIHIVKDNGANIIIETSENVHAWRGSNLILHRSRGTSSSKTYLNDGDSMGGIVGRGWSESQGGWENTAAVSFAADGIWSAGSYPGKVLFSTGSNGTMYERMVIDKTGNVGIGTTTPLGKLDVNGAIFQRGSSLHADYVFEKDYKLESIKEHKSFMFQNKHLKAVPKAKKDANGLEIVEVGSHRKGMLEELEKAHIYISQLESRLDQQGSTLASLQGKVDALLKVGQ